MNPASVMQEIGRLCRRHGALFCVDFVSSAFATPISVRDWNIDLGLCGTQKVLSLPPDLGLVTVSERAWKVIEQRKYEGYDALLPFRDAIERREMPYTHNWRAVHALNVVLARVDIRESTARHERVAALCRSAVSELGLAMFAPPELASPTCTALAVPPDWTWPELRSALRKTKVLSKIGPVFFLLRFLTFFDVF